MGSFTAPGNGCRAAPGGMEHSAKGKKRANFALFFHVKPVYGGSARRPASRVSIQGNCKPDFRAQKNKAPFGATDKAIFQKLPKSPFGSFLKKEGTSATAAGGGNREHEEWPRSKSARICADAPAAIFGHRNRIARGGENFFSKKFSPPRDLPHSLL